MWRLATATATGLSHERTDSACQDRTAWAIISDRVLVSVVADGAGSATRSGLGAEIAAQTALNSIATAVQQGQTVWTEIVTAAVSDARNAVLALAAELQTDARELASTLLAIVVGPDGGAAIQVGDGVIFIREESDDWCWAFWPYLYLGRRIG